MATSTGKKLGRPREEPTAPVTGQPRGRKSARTLALNELEADIDRLIFKVMGVGDLTEIEDSLRQARRLLYGASTGGDPFRLRKPDSIHAGVFSSASLLVDAKVLFSDDFHLPLRPSIVVGHGSVQRVRSPNVPSTRSPSTLPTLC